MYATYLTPLNQPQHVDNQFTKSPSSVCLIALGIILMIAGAVAAGMLYSQLEYVSLICLSAVPLGIALIILGIRCSRGDTRPPTTESGQPGQRIDDTISSTISTTNPEGQLLDNTDVLNIGSPEARLDEKGIIEELRKVKAGQDIEILIIYGDGNVRLNKDPGFVEINPKKVILVGARIVHDPCGGIRLDEQLAKKDEWMKRPRVIGGENEEYDTTAYVPQLIVSSVNEALEHDPPSRPSKKREKYHFIYQVRDEIYH